MPTASKIALGAKFFYHYADGHPQWEVVKARGGDTYDCVITEDSLDSGGVKKVFGGEEIRRAQRQEAFWAESRSKHVGWWESREIGEIVHYHQGFGGFVRGEIVVVDGEKMMKPVALVGPWQDYDLPRRLTNGEVRSGYHADKIASGEPMQPHESNMYESPSFVPPHPKHRGDPSQMAPINLTVPPATPAQDRALEADQLRQDIVKLLSECPKADNSADFAREVEARLARAAERISQHRYAGYQRGVQDKIAAAAAFLSKKS